ncbi:MAG: hypothetical protein M3O91_04265 [Chloroflexota bacterium]|nr:hypothetical protein [Chloroflexota bacterium]
MAACPPDPCCAAARSLTYAQDLDAVEATPQRRVEAVVGAVKAGWTFNPWEGEVASLEGVVPLAEEIGELRLLAEAHFWIAYLRRALGMLEGLLPAVQRHGDPMGAAMIAGMLPMGYARLATSPRRSPTRSRGRPT